ncbi:SET domain-containing protein SmydA-8 [Harpegnathos saltator]|uniref:Protein msta, isoform A n=1 Tax=Harpegnathos saltator TaxID=610380 RepID=E2BYA0_HARSA|nr:SET domain-containing protein SmydA-8 [Harpegnathos saltator]EFN79379.1 Protein msta, isoform A [Harpegnathos saltator]
MAPIPKYKVTHSGRLGRYLVAAKNIAAGEVIIREEPIAVGPMTYRKDRLCFACLRSLSKIGRQYVCSRCNLAPLCSVACETRTKHHTSDECLILGENRDLLAKNGIDATGILLALRLWLIKCRNPAVWEQVDHMEDHLHERMGTPVWKDREVNVVNVIRMLRVPDGIEPPSAELMQKLCGILDVNTFELRSPGALDGLLLRGLYVEAALMAHDCRGNTHLTVDDDFRLTVYASVAIGENEPILFNYTSSLLGTADRREHLREGKYFECECDLCKDSCELQSHLSSLLCPRCKKGFIEMQDTSIVDPYARESRWQCQTCKRTYGGRLIRATLNICRTLIEECEDIDIKSLDGLLKKLSRSLHTNHFLMLSLKQKLLATCRKEMTSPNPQKKIIQKMLDTCKEIYSVLDIVEPGISRLKGIMLYEMHLPMIILANRSYSAREISSTQLACQLEEARDLLKKALTMLLLEPATTPEGKLAKRALEELRTLNQNIGDVKSLPPEETKVHVRRAKENHKKIK